jgi:hypothetical protein
LPKLRWNRHNQWQYFPFSTLMAATRGSAEADAGSPIQGPPGTQVPLEGKALLDKARSLSNRPEDQIARACGYVGPSGRVLKKSFYRALVAAKGYAVPSSVVGSGLARGRQADFRTRVHGNGNLLIGQAYTRRMGLEPGQEFKIELHRETGSIWLLPLEEKGEQEA